MSEGREEADAWNLRIPKRLVAWLLLAATCYVGVAVSATTTMWWLYVVVVGAFLAGALSFQLWVGASMQLREESK